MGIKNLLKSVYTRPAHISLLANSSVAIDMSCMIYKGLYRGDLIKYVNIYIKRLTQLRCTIYMVFDGKPPQMKMAELAKRKSMHSGIKAKSAYNLIRRFHRYPNIRIIRSPEESDAQLAFLALNDYVDYVITDDSDLIVYGCEKIIFKLNPRGHCLLYERKHLWRFVDLNINVFRWMCILAGCDYMPGGYKGMSIYKTKKWIEYLSKNNELPKAPYDEWEVRKFLYKLPRMDDYFVNKYF